MKSIVTEEGVLIPRQLLKGAKEVEIRKKGNVILVIPQIQDDTIFQLGSNPIDCNTPDAGENLDKYIY